MKQSQQRYWLFEYRTMNNTETAYNLGYRVSKDGRLFLNSVPLDYIIFVKKKKNNRNLLGFHLSKTNKLVYLSKLQAYQKYGNKALNENCMYIDGNTSNCSYDNIFIKSELDKYLKDNNKYYCSQCHSIIDANEVYSNTNPHRIRQCKKCSKQKRLQKYNFTASFKTNGCYICGEKDIACLDFHHLSDKTTQVSWMQTHSYNTIKEEIDKCIVLCSNCHRKLHYYKLTLQELRDGRFSKKN